MKVKYLLPVLGGFVSIFVGCLHRPADSGVQNSTLAQWPAEIRQRVLAGQIDPGFTREQVEAALGRPHYKTVANQARAAEIWGYRESRPRAEYAFQSVTAASYARQQPATAGTERPKFLVFFDRDGRVTAVENMWW